MDTVLYIKHLHCLPEINILLLQLNGITNKLISKFSKIKRKKKERIKNFRCTIKIQKTYKIKGRLVYITFIIYYIRYILVIF